MNILLDSKILHSALAAVSVNVTNTRLLPIFGYAKFVASLGTLTITSASENGILSYDIHVNHQGSGTFYLEYALLRNILAILKQQPISLDVSATHVTLKHANGRLKFQQLEPHQIPEDRFFTQKKVGEDKTIIELKPSVWRSIFKHIKQHVSNDELRPAMCCIYLHGTDNGIIAAATDAHTMAVMQLEHKPITGGILLNKAAVKVLEKMVAKADDKTWIDFRFSYNEKSDKVILSISGERFEYSQECNTYKYPDYQSVISKETTHEFTVNKDAFQTAINRISSFFQDSVLDFEEKGKLTLYGDLGKYEGIQITETLDCEHEGMLPALMFHNRFFSRTLPFMSGDQLTLKRTSNSRGWMMEDEAKGLMYLIMPKGGVDDINLTEKRKEVL